MVEKAYQLVWTNHAKRNLRKVYNYISEDSPKNAEKVIRAISEAIYKTTKNPEFYPLDKYKTNNDGSYRAFEKYRYRVVYRFKKTTIRVLRIRHTSQEPLKY